MPGIVVSQARSADCYSGAARDLVASGLATLDMFPGQPGRPLTSARYRPLGVERGNESWFYAPGYMTIRRKLDGMFHISLTVSREEGERRRGREAARIYCAR